MTALFDLDRIFLFALLVARVAGLVVAAPFFGERMVPRRVKILLVVTLALLMLTFAPPAPAAPSSLVELVVLSGLELTVGLAIGFTGRLVLVAFEMAGGVIAIQMGLGMAQVIDPMQAYRGNLLTRWMWIVGMTLFLGLNGHHHLLRALAGTMDLVPPGRGLVSAGVVEAMVGFGADSFVRAMQIGAPAIGVLLLTSAGLGILARTVPQMNVFIVGFPVKIAAGIAAILLTMPYLLEVARREVAELVGQLSTLMLSA